MAATSASAWLGQQMRLGVRSKRKPYDEMNYTRRVRFVWDHARSRAAIRVKVQ